MSGEERSRREVLGRDGSAIFYESFLGAVEAAAAFDELMNEIPWRQREIVMFGRTVKEPRLTSWHGEPGVSYAYSGRRLEPEPIGPTMARLREQCQAVSGSRFNGALLNLYRDGNDGMSWHADDEAELGEEPVIASLSLGATRRFDFRHREDGETKHVELTSGSLLVMRGRCQRNWKHQLPKTRRVHQPRINVTFRDIVRPT